MIHAPYHTTLSHLTADNWREHAARKKQSVKDAIPKEWLLPDRFLYNKSNDLQHDERPAVSVLHVPSECGILTLRELEITELDNVAELLKRIESRQYTGSEVATAFCKRAAIAHQLTNCLSEIFFDRALKRAKELDEHLATTGKLVGPLHSVPISLKCQFDVKGIELTMGYAAWLGRISPENASIVTMLEEMGAVLYVQTNVPQALTLPDTFNWINGQSHNPYNLTRSPGGSSGGEGALIAMKGSILGIGSDVGGSVRIPAAFCGLHTIKPSTRRLPLGKASNSGLGQESILSAAGPMARSLETVDYFMRAVLNWRPADYDSGAMPFPYNDAAYDKALEFDKLAIGLAGDDGIVHLTRPMKRALDIIVEALKAAGHEVLDFPIAPYNRAMSLEAELLLADGSQEFLSIVEPINEPAVPGLNAPGLPAMRNGFEINTLNRQKEDLQQTFLSDWLRTKERTSTGRPIDALLVAPGQYPACTPGTNNYDGYTALYNVLDLPAVVLPVTQVDEDADAGNDEEEPYNEIDAECMKNFDAKTSAGLPVGIQLVGRRWQEEALLALSQRVEVVIRQKLAGGDCKE